MNEDNNKNASPQDQNATTAASGENGCAEKKFTQDEVNRIISERLSRERAKVDPDDNTAGKELTAREARLACKEYFIDKEYPKELLDILPTGDEKSFRDSVDKLMKLFPQRNRSGTYVESGRSHGISVGSDPVRNAFFNRK